MCEWCGVMTKLPPAPPEPDPVGDGPGRWSCRYCPAQFDTASEVRAHQARRHAGCGERLVTDAVELHPVKQ